jgi:hypothetical protein
MAEIDTKRALERGPAEAETKDDVCHTEIGVGDEDIIFHLPATDRTKPSATVKASTVQEGNTGTWRPRSNCCHMRMKRT